MCTEIDHDQPEGSTTQQMVGCTRGRDPVRCTDQGQRGQIDPTFGEIRCVENPAAGVDPRRGLTLFLGLAQKARGETEPWGLPVVDEFADATGKFGKTPMASTGDRGFRRWRGWAGGCDQHGRREGMLHRWGLRRGRRIRPGHTRAGGADRDRYSGSRPEVGRQTIRRAGDKVPGTGVSETRAV
jgi:hypothetical protein